MGFMSQSRCISLALLFILGAMATQVTSRTLQDVHMYEKHEEWMARYGRLYKDNSEKEKRFQIFKENARRVELFNGIPNQSYKLGLNQFADLTNEEFTASRNGFKAHMCSTEKTSFKYENVSALPSTVDWRKKGAVTPVKNQGQCGCCWAFSAVAAMEGINQLTNGKLISLSEQELVDCDVKGVDQGCNSKKESSNAADINGYEDVPANSEESLQKAVAHQPVSVAIDASGYDFQLYAGGVFTGSCGTDLDHGVTAVGYGVTSDGTKYWLVKNSWGVEWGEKGYIRMQRDVDAEEGLCGIAMEASYPTS